MSALLWPCYKRDVSSNLYQLSSYHREALQQQHPTPSPPSPPSLHPKPAPPPPLLSWPSGLWLFCAAAWREHWNLPRANKALSQRSRLQHHQVSSYIPLALDFMLQEWVPAGLQVEEMQHFSFWVMMSEFRGVTSWLILTHVSRL